MSRTQRAHDLSQLERQEALAEEEKKQKELDALKQKIFIRKDKDFIKGYLESLIGEKLKCYEDEADG